MDNRTNNNANNHANENAIAIIVVLAAFYKKYSPLIEQYRMDFMERLHNPFFVMFLVSSGVLVLIIFYSLGHYMEKAFNRINMWRQGIRPDDKSKDRAYPFITLDLKKQVNEFCKNTAYRESTFLGLNAEKQNKEIVSIPD